jgi:hypothetical protein
MGLKHMPEDSQGFAWLHSSLGLKFDVFIWRSIFHFQEVLFLLFIAGVVCGPLEKIFHHHYRYFVYTPHSSRHREFISLKIIANFYSSSSSPLKAVFILQNTSTVNTTESDSCSPHKKKRSLALEPALCSHFIHFFLGNIEK